MSKKLYEAFTLVEMLIVMGILIILMVIGITAGRFAINRANDVAHQNAVDQVYTGLQAYYTDERRFPEGGEGVDVASLIGTPGDDEALLNKYLDAGAFRGGTEATFYYFVEELRGQSVLVCVSLGGVNDAGERGFYCNGNGFGDADLTVGGVTGAALTEKNIPYSEDGAGATLYNAILGSTGANWDGNGWE